MNENIVIVHSPIVWMYLCYCDWILIVFGLHKIFNSIHSLKDLFRSNATLFNTSWVSSRSKLASRITHPISSVQPFEAMPTLAKESEMYIIPTMLLGGQKWPCESDHSESDKDSSHVLDPQHSNLLSRFPSFASLAHAKVDSIWWIDVWKKKGKKYPTWSMIWIFFWYLSFVPIVSFFLFCCW